MNTNNPSRAAMQAVMDRATISHADSKLIQQMRVIRSLTPIQQEILFSIHRGNEKKSQEIGIEKWSRLAGVLANRKFLARDDNGSFRVSDGYKGMFLAFDQKRFDDGGDLAMNGDKWKAVK